MVLRNTSTKPLGRICNFYKMVYNCHEPYQWSNRCKQNKNTSANIGPPGKKNIHKEKQSVKQPINFKVMNILRPTVKQVCKSRPMKRDERALKQTVEPPKNMQQRWKGTIHADPCTLLLWMFACIV